jgi:beta-glucanase (GH16 family)
MSKFTDWWNNLMGRRKTTTAPAAAPVPAPAGTPTFVDNFATLDPNKWIVSTWAAPGKNAVNNGSFSASNATIVNGMLCLKLTQTQSGAVINSVGGEIATKQSFGYGTYEFVVRASSTASAPDALGTPVSGSITGCFDYLAGSATEIDTEIEGGVRSALTQFTSWISDSKPNQTQQVSPANGVTPEQAFFTYKFVWSPGKIVFYRNDVVVATFTNVVPTQPAPFLFNHWGTNDPNWGGVATPGVDRYMWVKKFSYTPL